MVCRLRCKFFIGVLNLESSVEEEWRSNESGDESFVILSSSDSSYVFLKDLAHES